MTNEEAELYWLNHVSINDKEQSQAVWAAIDALEKRTPKEPIKHTEICFSVSRQETYKSEQYECPFCGETLEHTVMGNYCQHCGQAIKWEDEE